MLRALIDKYPKDFELHRAVSTIPFEGGQFMIANGNMQTAEAYFAMAQDLWPGHRGALRNLSVLAMKKEDFQRAFEFQKLYAKADSGLLPIMLRGDILRAQGLYREAIPNYKHVLRKDFRSLHALGGLATCLMRMGLVSEAIVTFRQVLELDPSNVFAQAFLEKVDQNRKPN